MKISNIMKKAIASESDITVREAIKIMSKENIGSLILLEKNKLVGIITERDILKNADKLNSKVSGIMSKSVVTINADDSEDNAALVMAKHKIKRLPVVEDGKLIGIITATDLIANADDLNENFLFEWKNRLSKTI